MANDIKAGMGLDEGVVSHPVAKAEPSVAIAEAAARPVTETAFTVEEPSGPTEPAGAMDTAESAAEHKGCIAPKEEYSTAAEEEYVQWSVRIEARLLPSGRRAGAEGITTAPAGSVSEVLSLIRCATGDDELLKNIGSKCIRGKTTVPLHGVVETTDTNNAPECKEEQVVLLSDTEEC